MSFSRRLGIIALSLILITWIFWLFTLPTVDLDESLYRRVADGMKSSGNFWRLQFDREPLYHKPPIFYWLIIMASYLVDGIHGAVSSFAARVPGFLSTLGIFLSLYFGVQKFSTHRNHSSFAFAAVLTFSCGFFPMMTGSSVIFDPLQTLCLMPALVIPAYYFKNEITLSKSNLNLWAVSMFLACAVKGLNGIIIPSFAVALHLLFSIRILGLQNVVRIGIRFLLGAFLPAALATSAFYYLLNEKIGAAFTQEFIWIQHFARTQTPMEQHSGNFFYHFILVFFGGGFLTPILFRKISATQWDYSKIGFPLTYAISFILIFTLSATKLPHYTWPVWPALALLVAFLAECPAKTEEAGGLEIFERILVALPVLLIGLMLGALALLPTGFFNSIGGTSPIHFVLQHFEGFNLFERALFLIGSAACFSFIMRFSLFIRSIEFTAFFSAVSILSLGLGLARTVNQTLSEPFMKIGEAVRIQGATPADCIRYSGPMSPTLSIALGRDLIHNRCDPSQMRYLVAPEWKQKECKERGMKVIAQSSYLLLCK